MSKFPLLNTYRTLALILAVVILIAGVLVSLGTATAQGFNLGILIATAVPFLVGAFALGVVAELIQLALRVEDHLDHIRQASERQTPQLSAFPDETMDSPPVLAAPMPTRAPAPSQDSSLEPTLEQLSSVSPVTDMTARIQVKVYTPVYTNPNPVASSTSSQISPGQALTAYGRSSDGIWLSISKTGRSWIHAADVKTVAGDVNDLPVVYTME